VQVNIGMELAADPTVLFLDEPTSGLDSSSSMDTCNALRRIADLGLTIVAVIHQPRFEIFTAFDGLS
jgi:ABC-type multidrug transport system ATPase subunit